MTAPPSALRFSGLSAAARALWAKSGEPAGHGLLAHMLDVAAVARAILARESASTLAWAAESFSLPTGQVAPWLAAMAGLHDFGKAIPGFQWKWPEGQRADAAAGLGFSSTALSVHRHDHASAALLQHALLTRCDETAWISAVCQALGAHHGYMPRSDEIKSARPRYEAAPWAAARGELLDAYLIELNPGNGPAVAELPLPAVAWFAGLTSVADWIGSNTDWFPPGERGETFAEHHAEARRLADQALDAIGWPAYRALLDTPAETDTCVRRILGSSDPKLCARPLQRIGDGMLEQANGPVLLIAEAPMGEGKTELALLAHLRLQAANGHRGLYLGMPTQATGNAMFDRALTFLRHLGAGQPLDLQLAHAGALLDERVLRLRGINQDEAEAVACSEWFAAHRRALLSPYGVGTVDQALFATLHVKHHFVRLWGLANRVVVLDEVHAYDTYTSGLIEALLRWLRALNCSVILMSATLPMRRRAALLAAWGAAGPPEVPYPRLLLARADGTTQAASAPARPLPTIEVSGLPEDLAAIAVAAAEALADGGCGLVVVNTVQRAQQLYRRLCDEHGLDADALLLFHARFPADERGAREREVLRRFGPPGQAARPARCLLIATQVAEQSLDLDFDFMFSDLAPVDLLLQRAGRLHRHQRPARPAAHAIARLRIAGLQPERPPELKETAWGYVYDPYVLYCTWGLLLREPCWLLPADIDRLVQAAYAEEPFEEAGRAAFAATLDRALGEHYATIQKQRQQAWNVAIEADAEPQHAYTQKPRASEERRPGELPVVTRLGAQALAVVPVLSADDGWRVRADDPPFDPNLTLDDALARRLFARQVRVSRKDLVTTLLAAPQPDGFAAHPLLRHLRPLPLPGGKTVIGRLRVRLDTVLGIVYEELAATEEQP